MANLLAEQYKSVFSCPKENMQEPDIIFGSSSEGATLENIYFFPEDIEISIDEISMNSAAGPDGFPAILQKHVKQHYLSLCQ